MSEKPSAILTSDWHLRETKPRCRIDNFFANQWKKVEFVFSIQQKYSVPVLHAGDLFHHWKPSPYLLTMSINLLPIDFYTVYGQHDMPNKNADLAYKSGVKTLNDAGVITALNNGSWGSKPTRMDKDFEEEVFNSIMILHQPVWDGKNVPWPGCDWMTAKEVLDEFNDYKLVLTGDHHKPFVYKRKNQILVNPGPLTRQSADENFVPRVYLYYAETNEVEPVYLPYDDEAVTREYIEQEEKRDKQMEAFVSRLNNEWDITISFEENVERFFSKNKVRKSVKEIINKAMEIENG